MDECLEWISERVNNDLIGEEERLNFEAFGRVLKNSDVIENHGGRFLLINNGQVWGETFGSPQDTFSEEFDGNCVLFRVPKDGNCDNATIFYSVSVGENCGDFEEVHVPVKVIMKKIPTGYNGPTEIEDSFMFDSGASDTSCPCHLGELIRQTPPLDIGEGFVSITGKWNMLAFWGKTKLACRKQAVRVSTANGKYTSSRLHFDNGQLSMKVGDSDEVEVKKLLLAPDLEKNYKRTQSLAQQSLMKPTANEKLLLGRDIVLKYFTTTIAKEVGQRAAATFNKRENITPPTSPSLARKTFNKVTALFGWSNFENSV